MFKQVSNIYFSIFYREKDSEYIIKSIDITEHKFYNNNTINKYVWKLEYDMNNRTIRAVYDDDKIRVYQAYNEQIAADAVLHGTFGKGFKLDRMTWIKPSFLWMMYRCGWGTKKNQEHILAVDIKREAFDYLIRSAICSTFNEDEFISRDEWKEKVKSSDIRVQWDPERDIHGNPLEYRSIQIGMRGEAVKKYITEWIVGISDITEYVAKLYNMRNKGENITGLLPQEQIYKYGKI